MGKSTASGIRLIALAAMMSLGACDSAQILNPFPENRLGTGVNLATNAPPMEHTLVEPNYIPSTEELLGLGEGDAQEYFGEPSLRRADQDAQIWQYQTDACVLFLFFYPDEEGAARIAYVTSSSTQSGGVSPGDQACVDAVTRHAANTGPDVS